MPMSEIINCPLGLRGRIRGMNVCEERIVADRKLAKDGGMQLRKWSMCLHRVA
jgi:hypothetical protein